MMQDKNVHIRTQKRNFGALDLQENTLVVSSHDLIKRPRTPDLNDYLKEYFDEYENKQNSTFTTASFNDFSSFSTARNVKPSSFFMEETPSKPRGKENINLQLVDGSPFTKQIDDIIQLGPKIDFSISGETEIVPNFSKRETAPQRTTPRARVTFNENDTNEAYTMKLNDFFAKQKDALIDFNSVEKTEETNTTSILKKPLLKPSNTTNTIQRKPLQRISPVQFEKQYSPSRGSVLLTQNLSTSTITHISPSNIDKFMSITGINSSVNYKCSIDVNGPVSNQLMALFEQHMTFLQQSNKELQKETSNIIDAMTENTPALMVNFLAMNQKESSEIKQTLIKLKELYTNEAISQILQGEIEIERMWLSQQQMQANLYTQLKAALKKSTDQSMMIHYTENDLKQKQAEIQRQKSQKEDIDSKKKYEHLLSILPFKVNNLKTKIDTPRVTYTEKNGKRATSNTPTAKPIYIRIAEKTRKAQFDKEIRELLTIAPDMIYDGKTLSFLITETVPSTIRFAVTVRIAPSYPWCRLHVVAIRQDIVPSDVSETVRNTAASINMGPNMILRFYHKLHSVFCSDF